MHEVVSEVGARGKLHLGLGNPNRMHHGRTLNRLSKHLWGLNTTHLLRSYRKRGFRRTACPRAPPPPERKAALTSGSHSARKGYANGLIMAL